MASRISADGRRFVLLTLVLALLAVASIAWLRSGRTVTFYDNGTVRVERQAVLRALVEQAAADPKALLGPDWASRPAYSARYFTLDLLGLDWRHDAWTQCASAGGNGIFDVNGSHLGTYIGCHEVADQGDSATVTLDTADGRSYTISMSMPWRGGPWIVTAVAGP